MAVESPIVSNHGGVMKYGMNLLLWTGDVSEADAPLCEELKKIGYDGVELPIFAGDDRVLQS